MTDDNKNPLSDVLPEEVDLRRPVRVLAGPVLFTPTEIQTAASLLQSKLTDAIIQHAPSASGNNTFLVTMPKGEEARGCVEQILFDMGHLKGIIEYSPAAETKRNDPLFPQALVTVNDLSRLQAYANGTLENVPTSAPALVDKSGRDHQTSEGHGRTNS